MVVDALLFGEYRIEAFVLGFVVAKQVDTVSVLGFVPEVFP